MNARIGASRRVGPGAVVCVYPGMADLVLLDGDGRVGGWRVPGEDHFLVSGGSRQVEGCGSVFQRVGRLLDAALGAVADLVDGAHFEGVLDAAGQANDGVGARCGGSGDIGPGAVIAAGLGVADLVLLDGVGPVDVRRKPGQGYFLVTRGGGQVQGRGEHSYGGRRDVGLSALVQVVVESGDPVATVVTQRETGVGVCGGRG